MTLNKPYTTTEKEELLAVSTPLCYNSCVAGDHNNSIHNRQRGSEGKNIIAINKNQREVKWSGMTLSKPYTTMASEELLLPFQHRLLLLICNKHWQTTNYYNGFVMLPPTSDNSSIAYRSIYNRILIYIDYIIDTDVYTNIHISRYKRLHDVERDREREREREGEGRGRETTTMGDTCSIQHNMYSFLSTIRYPYIIVYLRMYISIVVSASCTGHKSRQGCF